MRQNAIHYLGRFAVMARLSCAVSAVAVIVTLVGCGGGADRNDGGGGTTPMYAIGGAIAGLTGQVVLENNGGDDLTVSQSGAFHFANAVPSGGAYNVTVKTQPPDQICGIHGGAGTVGASDIGSVIITCSSASLVPLRADAGVHSATLTWADQSAVSFNLYV